MVMNDKKITDKIVELLYIAPLIVGMFIFKIKPCVQIIITSLKEDYNHSTKTYSAFGFDNYAEVLTDRDFLRAVVNTSIYVLVVVTATVIISTLLAWCLYRIEKISDLLQFFIFLPLISSDIAIGISWRYMFSDRGIINSILSGISDLRIGWLTDKSMSLVIFILYGIWFSLPMATLLLLSSLKRINRSLLIAARLDKASEFKTFIKIGVPYIKPTIFTVAILNCISSWLAFNGLFSLFNGSPGPYYNLYTIVFYIYEKIDAGNRVVGQACAASVLLLLIVSVPLIMRNLAKKENEKK